MITRKKDKILRDGVEVAVLKGKKVEYIGDGKRYRLPISKFLKKQATAEEEEIEEVPGKDEWYDAECPVIETWDMTAREAFPDAPGHDSPYGEKEPALVRWIYENHPEDFKNRYKGKRTCIDEDKPEEERPTVKAVRAQREGFNDARGRMGYRPEHWKFEGIFEREYKVGFKNGGGRV
jgi:hypothetical protein